MAHFRQRALMLADRRRQAIAANRADVDLVTSALYGDRLAEARKHVTALTRIAKEIGALQGARYEVICAVIDVDPQRGQGAPRPPGPGNIDAESVVAAVLRNVDLLTVETERRLGLQDSNLREEPRDTWPGPKDGRQPVQTSAGTLGMYRGH